MMAEAMLQPDLYLIEHELRRVAQLVVPDDQRVLDDDLALSQQPFGESGVVRRQVRIDLDAGDAQATLDVPPYRQPRSVDNELAQPELEQRQRRPRDDQIDAGQFEQRRGPKAGTVADVHATDRQARIPAIPAGRDGVDLHRLSQPSGKVRRDFGAMRFDLRKRDEAHREQ